MPDATADTSSVANTIQFLIDHLDPMGQGVSRRQSANHTSIITFIPKTLPGEEGKARVVKSSKGVEFAELIEITKPSSRRLHPECEHYARCGGCDYLHMSYQDEMESKLAALQFSLRLLGCKKELIEVIPASERFGYRNRVQLHYRHQHLGLIDPVSDQVLEVPHCKLVSPAIMRGMSQLYSDKSWKKDHVGRGHVEIYQKRNETDAAIVWNQPYAHGGFSQVNEVMNTRLLEWLRDRCSPLPGNTLLDLFSGDGNISDVLMRDGLQRWQVDSSPAKEGSDSKRYLQMDLYAEESLPRFLQRSSWKNLDTLILDPPRKGFSALAVWAKSLKPSTIIYVSCNPATLARDLQTLKNDKANASLAIEHIALCDLFPGTRHFETVVILRKA